MEIEKHGNLDSHLIKQTRDPVKYGYIEREKSRYRYHVNVVRAQVSSSDFHGCKAAPHRQTSQVTRKGETGVI